MSGYQPFTNNGLTSSLASSICVLAFSGLISSCGSDVAARAPSNDANSRAKKEAAISRLNAVVGKANESSQLGSPWKDTPDRIPKSVLQQMNGNTATLLGDSKDIDCDILNSVYPNLGAMFRDKLVKSMSLSVEVWISMGKGDSNSITPSQLQELQRKTNLSKRLEMEWAEWFNAHFDEINKALG